jgi:HEAT repeat protein
VDGAEVDLCVDDGKEELGAHNESRLGKNLMRYRQLFTDAVACGAARTTHTLLLIAALSFTASGYAHQQTKVPSRFGEGETQARAIVPHGQRKTDSQGEPQDPVQALLAQSQDSNPSAKLDAIHRLAQLREKRAVEPFINLLAKDPNPDIRRAAAYGLGQLGDPRAIPPLIASLKDENPDVCVNSIFAVARIGGPDRTSALIGALAHNNLHVCRAAAVGLVLLGDKSAVPPLIKSLDDNRLTVRSGAAYALGFLGDRRAVPALLRTLKDDRSLVRLATIGALGLLGDAQSVPALRQLMSKDPDPQVRARAAEALDRLKTLPQKPRVP